MVKRAMFVPVGMGFVGLQLFECEVCFSSGIGICGRGLIGWGFIELQLFECEACFPSSGIGLFGRSFVGLQLLECEAFFQLRHWPLWAGTRWAGRHWATISSGTRWAGRHWATISSAKHLQPPKTSDCTQAHAETAACPSCAQIAYRSSIWAEHQHTASGIMLAAFTHAD